MSDQTRDVQMNLQAEVDPRTPQAFEQVRSQAGSAGAAIKALATEGRSHMHSLGRAIMRASHGAAGLTASFIGMHGSMREAFQLTTQLHSGFMLARGAMDLLHMVAAKNTTGMTAQQAAANNLAVARGNEAKAEMALVAAKETVMRAQTAALASGKADLALTMELTAAKGRQAQAEMALAAAKVRTAALPGGGGGGGFGGFMGTVGGAVGRILPPVLAIGAGIGIVAGIVKSIRDKQEEAVRRSAERAAKANQENDLIQNRYKAGFLSADTERNRAELLAVRGRTRSRVHGVEERATDTENRQTVLQMFPEQSPYLRGRKMEGMQEQGQRIRDLAMGRDPLAAGGTGDAFAQIQKAMGSFTGDPALLREEQLAKSRRERAMAEAKEATGGVAQVQREKARERLERDFMGQQRALDAEKQNIAAAWAERKKWRQFGPAAEAMMPAHLQPRMLERRSRKMGVEQRLLGNRAKGAGLEVTGEGRVIAKGGYASAAEEDAALGRMVKAKEEATKAVEEHEKASAKVRQANIDEMKSWRDFAAEQAKFYKQQVRQTEDQIRNLKAQIGGMDQVDIQTQLHIGRKLKAGQSLSMEEERIGRQSPFLKKLFAKRNLQQFENTPGGKELMEMEGKTEALRRMQGGEKEWDKVKIGLENKITVAMADNSKQMADNIAKAILPMFEEIKQALLRQLQNEIKRRTFEQDEAAANRRAK